MHEKTIEEVEEIYDLELFKVISEIKKAKAKLVLLQFPDGLKPYATAVVDYLKNKTKKVEFIIWLGTCYGACDTPLGIEKCLVIKINFVLIQTFLHPAGV